MTRCLARIGAMVMILLLGAVLDGQGTSARAERILADLSDKVIRISSNFTGSRIVIFGMIERDASTIGRPDPYDVVVVVRGWDETIVSRRKDRVVGIWVNKTSRAFREAPNFYAMSSTRDLAEIATPKTLSELQLGTDYLLTTPMHTGHIFVPSLDSYRQAALRLMRQRGLYRDDVSSVSFLNDKMFRTQVAIPANVEVGRYEVTIYLLRGGALLHTISQPLNVAKAGFEQIMSSLARDYALVYGLICVAIAIFTGWFIGIVFRKN